MVAHSTDKITDEIEYGKQNDNDEHDYAD